MVSITGWLDIRGWLMERGEGRGGAHICAKSKRKQSLFLSLIFSSQIAKRDWKEYLGGAGF